MPDRGNCAKTETNCFFSQPYTVLPGVCDRSARLSHVEAFTVCQDLATLHASQLGVGALCTLSG